MKAKIELAWFDDECAVLEVMNDMKTLGIFKGQIIKAFLIKETKPGELFLTENGVIENYGKAIGKAMLF